MKAKRIQMTETPNGMKGREWWLIYDSAYGDIFGTTKVNEDDIHVIEYSAYLALEKANKFMHEESMWKGDEINRLQSENSRLRAALEKCKEQRDDAIWNRFKLRPQYEKVFFADELGLAMDAELDKILKGE